MALVSCADCGHQLSPSAASCPNCGKPQRPSCPHCGESAVVKAEGLQGAKEIIIGLILFAFLFIPGLAYYFDRQSHPWCSACKRRVPKSLMQPA
jgi:predicted RNA-binding Zn-ribbon protein involved in translation (DUF1610 family)